MTLDFVTQAFFIDSNLCSGPFYILITVLASHDPNLCPDHELWMQNLKQDLDLKSPTKYLEEEKIQEKRKYKKEEIDKSNSI